MSAPTLTFEVAFPNNPLDIVGYGGVTAITFTDLAADLETLSITRGRQSEDDQAQTGNCTGVLSDDARKYDPNYASSPYYPNVLPVKPLRVQGYLPDLYKQAVLALNPSLYWRLGESSGTAAVDSSGNGRTGTYGAGITLGQAGAIAGDPTTSVSFNNNTNGVITSSYTPFARSSKRTFMGWAYRSSTADADTLIGGSDGTTFPMLRFQAANGNVDWYANGGSSTLVTWTGAYASTGAWFHWALVYDDSTLGATLYINGTSKGTLTLGPGGGFSNTGGNFLVGSEGGPSGWNGRMQDASVFERALTASEVAAIYNASVTTQQLFNGWVDVQNGWVRSETEPGRALVSVPATDAFDVLAQPTIGFQTPNNTATQLTGTRISQCVDKVMTTAWPRKLDAGAVTLQPVSTGYSGFFNALQAIRDAELSEPGFFFIDKSGRPTFKDKNWAPSSVATFCDAANVAAGRVLYESVTTRRTPVVNDVYVTRVGGTQQRANDSTSWTKYCQRSKSYSTQHNSDTDALSYANAVLAKKKDSYETLESLTLRPGTDSATWAQVLLRELGDRITVVRTPSGSGSAVTADYLIEAIALTYGPGVEASCTWRLSPA